MGRRSNGKEKDTKRKDPRDNGKNEARDNGAQGASWEEKKRIRKE